MINLEVLLCYSVNTILNGEPNVEEFIAEEFKTDECLWETFVNEIQKIYGDKDVNFVNWLGRKSS